MAKHIMGVCDMADNEARSYATLRWMTVTALSTGKLPRVPESEKASWHPSAKDSVRGVYGEALVFEGKAHLGMGTSALRATGTSGAMSKQSIAKILGHLAKATECEWMLALAKSKRHQLTFALFFSGYKDSVEMKPATTQPMHDLPMFQDACRQRLNEHLKATQR